MEASPYFSPDSTTTTHTSIMTPPLIFDVNNISYQLSVVSSSDNDTFFH